MNTVRTILAAPGIGMVHGTFGADETLLFDRRSDGYAFPGERLVRVPRRLVRDYHGAWLMRGSKLGEAARRAAP